MTTPLLLEDSRGTRWRIDPDGRMAEITRELYEAGPEACLNAPADMHVSFFDRPGQESRAPFDVVAFQKCAECGGRGYVDCMVVSEFDGEHHGIVRRFNSATETLDDLKPGQSVGPNVWDCDACPEGGYVLAATGAQLTGSELRDLTRRAA